MLLTSIASACGGGPETRSSGLDSASGQARDSEADAGDAGPVRPDLGALGPQCSAVVACCPLHSSMFASLAECEDFAARLGEDLCMDRRRLGWCDTDGGSPPD